MKSHISPVGSARIPFTGLTIVKRVLPLMLGILVNTTTVQGQRSDRADGDRHTIQMLLQKVEQLEARDGQLEARVAQLESAGPKDTSISASQVPARASMSSGETTEQQGEEAESPETEPGETLLKIRGYGDFSLQGDNQKGDKTSFSLGELNLFVTSDISEKFKFLSELVFESERTGNAFKAEPERLLLQYIYSDYFKLSAGRYHTAIGYYNTAYHHSTWFQTTTGRPYLFQFEDEGGILPVHNVGVSATGQIPSGTLGLNYVVEVGNGRASRSPRDVLLPAGSPKIGETILDAYAVFVRPKFEWLNEALVIRDTPLGGRLFETPGFYTQISERFGAYRPYLRYQYVNAPNNEPVFQNSFGVVVGLRQARPWVCATMRASPWLLSYSTITPPCGSSKQSVRWLSRWDSHFNGCKDAA